jgi:diguanylate cyclase (GGDEF)-like protein
MAAMRFSLRSSLWLPIVVMGLVAIVLVLVTASMYHDLTLENRRQAIHELLQIKADELLQQLAENSRALAMEVQRDPDFHKAFMKGDQATVRAQLNEQFHRYFQTAEVVQLQKLFVFDVHYRLVAESTELPEYSTASATNGLITPCNSVLDQAQRRTGAENLKMFAQLCVDQDRTLYGVVVPIGNLRPSGFMMVVTNPTHSLALLSRELGMPVRMSSPQGRYFFKSTGWPAPHTMSEMLVAERELRTDDGKLAMKVALSSNIQQLERSLKHARNVVLAIAGGATALVALITLVGLQRSTLQPLHRLMDQIQVVQRDRKRLGEKVVITGNREIRALSSAFNRMTEELETLYEALEEMAFRDALTGLPNRTLFNDRVAQLITQCERRGEQFAMFMMDLDRFKQINDSLGHPVGDALLQQAAERLNTALRRGDTVSRPGEDIFARLGGDEFAALIVVNDGADTISVIAKRLLQVLSKPFDVTPHRLHVDISIGVAMYPSDGTTLEELMRHSDVAMYHAKQAQRGFAFYDKVQDEHSLELLALEESLRQALADDALEVYFQPKVRTADGGLCGAEALLRWQHPTRGWISPDIFIPIAEQTGLIDPLTQWVLEHALAHCAAWQRLGWHFNVAVNLSARSLRDENLSGLVEKSLRWHGVPASSLVLEITENAIMADPARAQTILAQLDAMGVLISVDDFGTGHSSLAYLKRLPVTELKIDKSFVLGVLEDPNDAAIVRATIELGHNLGLRVVAEGVETAEIYDYLRGLACDVSQGYFHARPMPPEQFLAFLSSLPLPPDEAEACAAG